MPNFDVKQLSHIATELVVIGAVSYYFQSRCNRLQKVVVEDHHKIEEQAKRIEALENQVSQLSNMIQMITSANRPMHFPMPMGGNPIPAPSPIPLPKNNGHSVSKNKKVEIKTPSPEENNISIQSPTLENLDQFFRGSSPQSVTKLSSGLSDADDDADSIDAEIENELAELN